MIISRYLTREVFNSLLAVITVLLLAFLCQQLVRYLNYAAVGKIPTAILFKLVGFEIPNLLGLLLPLSLYLGILLTYGRLYADHEMSILQMCGFGSGRLMWVTLVVTITISAVVLFLMLWLNPLASAKRQEIMSSDAATLHLIQTLIPGRFRVSPGGQHVMYVEKLSHDRERAKNVFLAREKKDEDESKPASYMLVVADQGYQIKDESSTDQFFVAKNGYRYEGVPGHNDYKITQFKKYQVRIPQNAAHINQQEIEAMTTEQLWKSYNDPKHAAELQWRFSIAISTFLLALLAVPLSAVQPRKGRYLAIFPAVLVYVVYVNVMFIARRWTEKGSVSIDIGMWWVHGFVILFIITAMLFSMRINRK